MTTIVAGEELPGLPWGVVVAPVLLGVLSWVYWMCWSGRWRGWFYQRWDGPVGKLSFGYAGMWVVSFFFVLWCTVGSLVVLLLHLAEDALADSPAVESLWTYLGRPVFVVLAITLPLVVVAMWNSLDVHTKVHKRGRFPWSIRLLAPSWFKQEVLRQVKDMPDRHTPPPNRGLPPEHDEQPRLGGEAHTPGRSRPREAPPPPPPTRNPGSIPLPPPPLPDER